MSKRKIVSIVAGMLMFSPLVAFAQDRDTIAALQQQIAALQQQLANLNRQSGGGGGSGQSLPTTPPMPTNFPPRPWPPGDELGDDGPVGSASFDRDLRFGMRNDPDVSNLQEFLTDQGFYNQTISGNFFILTRNAVKKFQQAHGIKPSGYFGSLTRAVANKILAGEEVSPVTPPPFPVPPIPPTPTVNLSPVISGLKGPTTLRAGERGTWTVTARDPENGSLSYHITWGDEEINIPRAAQAPAPTGRVTQTATFTHTYARVGAFVPVFVVVDEGGLSAQTSASVTVVGPSAQTITLTAPNGGEQWQLNSLHTITWTPYDPQNRVNVVPNVSAYLEKLVNGNFITIGKIIEAGKASIHWIGEIDQYGNYPQPGSYYIRIVNNRTGESDRSNGSFELVAQNTVKADLKINGSDGPIALPTGGGTVTFSWTSQNADTCKLYLNGMADDIVNLPPVGQRDVFLRQNPYAGQLATALICQSSIGSASDDVFISPYAGQGSYISVTSPNGGENISLSSPSSINWVFSPDINKVSIALYKNDAFFRWIVTDVPWSGPGLLSWNPSSIISNSDIGGQVFKIYIIGYKASGGTMEDKSDAPFSIAGGTISQPLPDLKITNLTVNTPVVYGNRTYFYTATLYNDSETDVIGPFQVNIGGTPVTIPSLRAHSTAQAQGSFGLSIPGPNNVYASVDDPNEIAESNESNNSMTKVFNVAATYQGEGNLTLHHWETLRVNNGLILYADGVNYPGAAAPFVRFKVYDANAGYQVVADTGELRAGQTWTSKGILSRNLTVTVNRITTGNSPGGIDWSADFTVATQETAPPPAPTTDLRITSITRGTFHPYGFNMTLCMDGPQSINDLKRTNPNLKGFPADYVVYDSRGNRYRGDASSGGSIEDMKNGQCQTLGWTIQQSEQAAYDQTRKVEIFLDPSNIIQETNESNNSMAFVDAPLRTGPAFTVSNSRGLSGGTITAGAVNVTLASFSLDATYAPDALRVTGINTARRGTGLPSDLNNCRIVAAGGTALNTGIRTVNPVEGATTLFTFDTPMIIPKGSVAPVDLMCNVAAGAAAGNTSRWDVAPVQSLAKQVATGEWVEPIVTNATGPTFTIGSQTSVSVIIAPAATIPAQNISAGIANSVLGGFDITVSGEPVTVSRAVVRFSVEGSGAQSADITSVYMYDQNGTLLAGPVDVNSSSDVIFTGAIALPIGKTTLVLKGKPGNSFANGQRITASVSPSTWTVVGRNSGASVVPAPSNAVFANTMTVKKASLEIIHSSSGIPTTIPAGTQGAWFVTINLNAYQSSEDVSVSSLQMNLTSTQPTALINCRLTDIFGAVVSSTVNPAQQGVSAFALMPSFALVSRGALKPLTLKCDVSLAAQGSSHQWVATGSGHSVTGAVTGQAITPTVSATNVPVVTITQ